MNNETQEDIFVQWTCPQCQTYFETIAPIFEDIGGFYASFTCEDCGADFDPRLETL